MGFKLEALEFNNISIKSFFRFAGARFARIRLHTQTLLDDELWDFYVESSKDIRKELQKEKK